MTFARVLARLAAQILLGIAVFLWGAIAVLDTARGDARWVIGLAAVLALLALLRLGRSGRWVPWAAAVGLILPIGMLAHDNGGSPWLWILWGLIAMATASWIRDGHEVRDT
ncbi:MAG: hypothetical protein Q4B13_04890 [Lautropia sp.]|nr:hypothetical protein [Lautropia sp.]